MYYRTQALPEDTTRLEIVSVQVDPEGICLDSADHSASGTEVAIHPVAVQTILVD
jgi:hypothetical protein